MMALDPRIEWLSWDLVPEYCHGLESSKVDPAPPFVVKSLRARSNMSPPHLALHMHGKEIIVTFVMSNIYISEYPFSMSTR